MLEKQLPYKYKVYEVLKEEILNGSYPPGAVLNERRLSEYLGISRTPVREALQMLEQDGWLTIETYRGAVIREMDLEYMEEVGCIRKALEQCAVEEAAGKMQEGDLERLEEIHEKQREAMENQELSSFMAMDREFHVCIYSMSRNRALIQLLKNYYDIYQYMGTIALMGGQNRWTTTMEEHEAILEALRKKDAGEAVKAMRGHMDMTVKSLRLRMEERLEKRK